LEFAVGEAQTPQTCESDRTGYFKNFSGRTGNCSEEFTNSEFTNSAKFRKGPEPVTDGTRGSGGRKS
jgi:hypothetical protein